VIPAISISLLAGALAVDNRSSVRLLISQPVCGGLLAGLVLGNPRDGFIAGACLQMMFLGTIPVRGIALPDLPLGGVGGSALYILAQRSMDVDPAAKGLILFLSLAAALVVAAAGCILHRFWESRSYFLSAGALRLAGAGRFRLAAALHFSSVAVHFAAAFALTAVVVLGGVPAIAAVVEAVRGRWCEPLRSLPVLLPFIGAGALVAVNLARVRIVLFLAGFCAVFLFMFFRG
jgi:fructoselysine and glucoselysine-specific PTS system IIC component